MNHHKYVFHHIPKCGGNSVKKILSKWFNLILDYKDSYDNYDAYANNKINLTGLSQTDLLCGHFSDKGMHIIQRYPILNNEEYRIITFLRDPIEVAQSLYWYNKSIGVKTAETPELAVSGYDNLLSEIIPCTWDNYKEVIDRYWFVGICEDMQTSMDVLADMLGHESEDVPLLNTAARDTVLTPDIIREFKHKNRLDYRIYYYALERFQNLCRVPLTKT